MNSTPKFGRTSALPLIALVVISSLAIVGDEAASMSMVLTAVDQGQTWMVTWFSLSLAIPAMILAPFGGAIVDRYDPPEDLGRLPGTAKPLHRHRCAAR
ncbi:hypothetical protein AAHB37_04950 [Glutamicibacter halophytocola]|uniref:hypothetical protein n=1 Tax=Glutamicibacter halophytocola TaxID=1933880 RepID=UPI00321A3B0E